MPTPIPDPTPAEIVTLADIVLETTDSVRTAIAADSDQDISDAKWAQTIADMATWAASYPSGKRQLKRAGNVEFYESKTEDNRLDLRNTIRRRYRYADLTTENTGGIDISSLQWFGRRCW